MSGGIDIRLEPDFKQVRKWMRTLPDQVVDKATVRTLNRLVRVANTQAKRNIARPTGLKNKYVGKWIKPVRARRKRWAARMDINRIGMSTSLSRFPHRVKYVRVNGRKLQKIEFKKGLGPASARIAGYSNRLFKATGIGGREQIFMRETESRLPITKPKGPTMGELFDYYADGPVRREIRQKMPVEFERNFNYYMTRHNAKYSRKKLRR